MMWLCTAASIIDKATTPADSAGVGVSPELESAIRTIIVIMVLGAVPVIIASLNGVLAIIDRFKAKPPLHREYATKLETAELERRINEKILGHGNELEKFINRSDKYRDDLGTKMEAIAKQMGRVVGWMERDEPPRRRRGAMQDDT